MMYAALEWVLPILPENKPRYLMGIGIAGRPVCRSSGASICSTAYWRRLARRQSVHPRRSDHYPQCVLSEISGRLTVSAVVRRVNTIQGYIRHLLKAGEILGMHDMLHNLHFILGMMQEIRNSLDAGCFTDYRREFMQRYDPQRNDASQCRS